MNFFQRMFVAFQCMVAVSSAAVTGSLQLRPNGVKGVFWELADWRHAFMFASPVPVKERKIFVGRIGFSADE
jgi:hypothetical protein